MRCWPGPTRCPACSAASPRCSPSQPGHEAALAAALGGLADAVARQRHRRGRRGDAYCSRSLTPGGPRCVVGGRGGTRRPAVRSTRCGRTCRTAPAGRPTSSSAPTASARPCTARCATSSSSPTWPPPAALVADNAELRAVTPDGDVLGAYAAAGGSGKATSYIEVQAAVDEARASRQSAEQSIGELQGPARRGPRRGRRRTRRPSTSRPPRSGRPRANATPPPAASPSWAPPPAPPRPRPTGSARPGRRPSRPATATWPASPSWRNGCGWPRPPRSTPNPPPRTATPLAALVPQARQNEMEVRLAVRTAEERVSSIAGRADSLMRQANAERQARERAAARRAARARGAEIARAVELGARAPRSARVGVSLAAAEEARDALASARTAREAELAEVRGQRQTPRRRAGPAHQRGAPRRGGPRRAAVAHRAVGGEGRRGLRPRRRDPDRRVRPGTARPADPGRGRRRPRRTASRCPSRCRSDRPTQEKRADQGRTGSGPARQGQPARAGGVRGAGGAVQVPLRPARGPQGHPAGPAHRGQGRRRPDPGGLRRRRSRTPPASSRASSRCSSPAARAGWCSPTPTTC